MRTREIARKEDAVAVYYMEKEATECFDTENSVFAVEVPSKQHHLPEVKEAKEKEIQNLTNLVCFREVKYDGTQRPLGSRWVITKKRSMMA